MCPNRTLWQSGQIALKGLANWLRSQPHARAWLAGLGAVVAVAVCLEATPTQWGVLLLAAMSVGLTELLNTAIERLADIVSPRMDPRIGAVKDLAAAAVLLSILATGLVVGLVAWDRWGFSTHQ